MVPWAHASREVAAQAAMTRHAIMSHGIGPDAAGGLTQLSIAGRVARQGTVISPDAVPGLISSALAGLRR